MKICTKCGVEQPVENFGQKPVTADGLRAWCKSCERAAAKARYDRKPPTSTETREKALRVKYGISITLYEAMLEDQDFGCAICGASEADQKYKVLCVDHDHITGAVRGLLCDHCNLAIGQMADNPVRLRRAADYLDKKENM